MLFSRHKQGVNMGIIKDGSREQIIEALKILIRGRQIKEGILSEDAIEVVIDAIEEEIWSHKSTHEIINEWVERLQYEKSYKSGGNHNFNSAWEQSRPN